ncbi:DUF2061 domain-containing protein [Flavivirga spongiicola]|uniref:DUF2061 domain-containing protein n=1 Tax=Flavivirga spongiicola TaxID=421621 RepID=A0ABU7XV04_9FLAO|nr:DUF2061 domain-containing protein [Flavivirga sp. MEBiC05379]MDO5979604.1 DUF2061 domain-containing protein [Flavivirga sp. MEBiC05379]
MIAQMLLKNKEKSTYKVDSTGEKPIRSIAKALSWRVIGTLDTLIVSYVLTQEITVASLIASVDFLTKMVLYFFHERVWNKIKWGK